MAAQVGELPFPPERLRWRRIIVIGAVVVLVLFTALSWWYRSVARGFLRHDSPTTALQLIVECKVHTGSYPTEWSELTAARRDSPGETTFLDEVVAKTRAFIDVNFEGLRAINQGATPDPDMWLVRYIDRPTPEVRHIYGDIERLFRKLD